MNEGLLKSATSRWRQITVMMVAVVALTATAAMALAASGGDRDDGVLFACVAPNGTIRLVDDSSACRRGEEPVSWNTMGAQGPAGPEGPAGPQGSTDVTVHIVEEPPVASSASAYIKFDGVDGEARDEDHDGWIDLLSFDHVIHVPTGGVGSGRVRGRALPDDFQISKPIDKSTPKLAEAIATGKVFSSVVAHLTKEVADGSRPTYLSYELKNVFITSYSVGGSGQSDQVPTEELSLNFEEIKVTYTEYDDEGREAGKVEYTWKVEEGES